MAIGLHQFHLLTAQSALPDADVSALMASWRREDPGFLHVLVPVGLNVVVDGRVGSSSSTKGFDEFQELPRCIYGLLRLLQGGKRKFRVARFHGKGG